MASVSAREDNLDLEVLIKVAEAAADAAGAVIRPYFRTSLSAQAKADESPVTVADRQAEQAICAVLRDACPGFGLIGEEYGETLPDARLRWVVDPIDGTRAFITGRPTFGTLIALLDGDRPVLGLLYQPVSGERWIGAAGRPTRFRGRFGGSVGTRPCFDLAQAELSCTAPDMVAGTSAPRFERLAAAARRVSWGGDCYAYGLLALGQLDMVAEGDLKLWDWAALVPIVEGAGGAMTDWAGAPLRPDGDGRALAVGDARLLALAVARLTESEQ